MNDTSETNMTKIPEDRAVTAEEPALPQEPAAPEILPPAEATSEYIIHVEPKQTREKFPVFALISMIAGILAMLTCPLGFTVATPIVVTGPLSILAFVFALVSKKKKQKMNGMAVAGLILGIVGILFSSFFLLLTLLSLLGSLLVTIGSFLLGVLGTVGSAIAGVGSFILALIGALAAAFATIFGTAFAFMGEEAVAEMMQQLLSFLPF